MPICEFCKKNISTTGNLVKHQKTAMYCLRLQNKVVKFHCEHCNFNFNTKASFKMHGKCYKVQYENLMKDILKRNKIENIRIQETYAAEIKYLQDTIIRLEDRLESIAQRVTNNLAIFDLTQARAREVINEKLEFEHIKKGLAGIADFSCEHLLKQKDGVPMYICTDPSRGVFYYIHPLTQQRARDMEAHNLVNIISDPVKQKSKEIFYDQYGDLQDFYRNKYIEIQGMNKNARSLWRRIAVLAAE